MKRQPTEWEKVFANKMTDKALIFTIYKQLTQLSIKLPCDPAIPLWAYTWRETLPERLHAPQCSQKHCVQ